MSVPVNTRNSPRLLWSNAAAWWELTSSFPFKEPAHLPALAHTKHSRHGLRSLDFSFDHLKAYKSFKKIGGEGGKRFSLVMLKAVAWKAGAATMAFKQVWWCGLARNPGETGPSVMFPALTPLLEQRWVCCILHLICVPLLCQCLAPAGDGMRPELHRGTAAHGALLTCQHTQNGIQKAIQKARRAPAAEQCQHWAHRRLASQCCTVTKQCLLQKTLILISTKLWTYIKVILPIIDHHFDSSLTYQ